MKKGKARLPYLLLSAAAALCGCSDDSGDEVYGHWFTLQTTGLAAVGPDYVYEGWLLIDGDMVSVGRADIDDSPYGTDFETDLVSTEGATAFILTLEPAQDDDPAPSETRVLAGDIEEEGAGEVLLNFRHPLALGLGFEGAAGQFMLTTPSTADVDSDETEGIWWMEQASPTSGYTPSLQLPELGPGWVYEGWVMVDTVPHSTGRFSDGGAADADGAGPAAGSDPAPPFPGQDFVAQAISLPGRSAFITVEPEPDYSVGPFVLRPLVADLIEASAVSAPQAMERALLTEPYGQVWITKLVPLRFNVEE